MKRHITIKDIANELGISTSTVSRALADRWDVNEETRKLVLETAKRLNYHPNPLAVALITKQSKTIGLVIPEFENSFFCNIINSIQKVLNENGYQLLITQSNESKEIEERNLRLLENNMVDGIIISITREGENHELYQELIGRGIHLVFFNRVCTSIDAPKVIIDDYEMAFKATEHLIDIHCHNIAHLSGPPNLEITQRRKQGYLDALIKHNMPINENLILTAGVIMDAGVKAMNRLFESGEKFDGIFAVNDPVAIGAMKVIKGKGLKIPDDVAIIGFSESRSAMLVEPNLSSVAQPLSEIGLTAANLMLKLIRKKYIEEPIVKLNASLNIRESAIRS